MSDEYRQSLELRLARAERTLEALASREHVATVVPWSGLSGGVVYVDASGTGALTTEAAFIYDDTNDELVYGRARLTEQATPGTPVNPYAILFADTNGVMSSIDDAGVVRQMVQYAEGVFTPTYFGATTAGVTTYIANGQQGVYTRMGDRVDFALFVGWSNATGTGNAVVGGLPFTARNITNLNYTVSTFHNAITYAAGNGVQAIAQLNTITIPLFNAPASNVAVAALAVEVAGQLTIQGTYFI